MQDLPVFAAAKVIKSVDIAARGVCFCRFFNLFSAVRPWGVLQKAVFWLVKDGLSVSV